MRMSIRMLLPLFAASLTGLPGLAYADQKTGGTIIPGDVTKQCVKEKVQQCHWEGDRHICEWVDGPNCAVVRVQPGSGVRVTPGKLKLQR